MSTFRDQTTGSVSLPIPQYRPGHKLHMAIRSRRALAVWMATAALVTAPVFAQQAAPAPAPAAAAPAPTVQPVETPAPATQPATGPTTTATTAPATQPAIAAAAPTLPVTPIQTTRPYDPNAHVVFNFKDATVDSVLDHLSDSLGFIVIKDGPVSGRVTMISRQAVGGDDAVELLNSVLKPLNYTAIRTGRVLRVISRDKAKKINIPVHLGADPAEIRSSDELITQVIPLSSVDAVRVRQDLQALFSPDADVTANASSNTLIITDSSANIKRIVEVLSAMDRTMASTSDIKVFQLQYASASSAAKLINDLFKTDQTTGQGGGGGAGGRGGGPGGRGGFGGFPGFGGGGGFPGFGGFGGGGGAGGAGAQGAPGNAANAANARAGKVAASSDDRTNTLVVTGPTAVLQVISEVVKELDSNPSQMTKVFVYSLRNGTAARMAAVLNSLFGVGGGSSATSNTPARQPFGGFSSGSGFGGGGGGFGGGGGGFGGGGFGGGGGGFGGTNRGNTSTGNFFGGGNISSNVRAIASELTGQVFVVADPDTNSLLITTAPKFELQVKEILAELDRSVPQVLIKVLFAEVTHTDDSDVGIQGSIFKTWSIGGANVGTDFGLQNQTSGLQVGLTTENFKATLAALETTGKLDVLSRPYILTADNQLASILVGQQVPLINNSRITDTGQTINTVQYQAIGIILNVTPHINPDGKVIMDVSPEISALAPVSTVQIAPGVDAPVFNTRNAQSRVAVDNGMTIVIGGLMEDKNSETVRKVPILGDIPWAGALFRRTILSKSKTELLIFLTPHVVREAQTLHGMSKDEVKGLTIVPDAVSPGTFAEQMKGMQRGSTTKPVEPIYVPPPPTTQKGLFSK